MKIFVLFSGMLFLIYLIFQIINSKKFKPIEFMSRKYTNILKAIAIILVVWGHVGARMGVSNLQFVAGAGVSLFLICSGFGLESSYQKIGLKDYWRKKIVKIVLPFWLVELVGIIVTGNFTLNIVLKDFLIIKPVTSYGWYIQYIMICYVIFWVIMKLKAVLRFTDKYRIGLLFSCFTVWFLIESVFFANQDMPFLKARQMMSFPLGAMFCQILKQYHVESYKQSKLLVLTTVGLIFGGSMMLITQLRVIKSLPYIESNLLSLFTVLPLAIAIMIFVLSFQRLVSNHFFYVIGTLSYEIYLIHAFSLGLINGKISGVLIFVLVTAVFVIAVYTLQKYFSNVLLGAEIERRNYG